MENFQNGCCETLAYLIEMPDKALIDYYVINDYMKTLLKKRLQEED